MGKAKGEIGALIVTSLAFYGSWSVKYLLVLVVLLLVNYGVDGCKGDLGSATAAEAALCQPSRRYRAERPFPGVLICFVHCGLVAFHAALKCSS